MDKKELNKRIRNRVLVDEIFSNMKEIDIKIQSYSENMDDNSFNNSNEVEELYDNLRNLALDLWYIKPMK